MPRLQVKECRLCGGKIYWLRDERGQSRSVDTVKKWFISYGTGDVVRMLSGYPLHSPTCHARRKGQPQAPRQQEEGDRRPW